MLVHYFNHTTCLVEETASAIFGIRLKGLHTFVKNDSTSTRVVSVSGRELCFDACSKRWLGSFFSVCSENGVPPTSL